MRQVIVTVEWPVKLLLGLIALGLLLNGLVPLVAPRPALSQTQQPTILPSTVVIERLAPGLVFPVEIRNQVPVEISKPVPVEVKNLPPVVVRSER